MAHLITSIVAIALIVMAAVTLSNASLTSAREISTSLESRISRSGETARTELSLLQADVVAVQTLTEGMVELGLLPGPVEDAVEFGWYREFYFHGTGHWLGLDVHDAGAYRIGGIGRPLQPGMAFTIEPGIYVATNKATVELASVPYDGPSAIELSYLEGADQAKRLTEEHKEEAGSISHSVPEEFLAIGVRIEDDVLVTEDGIENLSRGVPVDPDEIEALAGERSTVPGKG